MNIGFVFLIPLVVIAGLAAVIFIIVLLIKWGLSGPQPSFKKSGSSESSGSSGSTSYNSRLELAKDTLRDKKKERELYIHYIDECHKNNGKCGWYDTAYYRDELEKIERKIKECEQIIEEEEGK